MNQSLQNKSNRGLRWMAVALFFCSALHIQASDAPDLDGDGVPNIVDPDIDNDGIPNALDDNVDGGIAKSGPYAGQYIGDHINNDNPAEKDIDGDGQADDSLGETDIDGDSKNDNDPTEHDIDGDRRDDDSPSEMDIDGDGRLDDALNEDDIDGDSLDDDDILEEDIDGDESSDSLDGDLDGDNRMNNGALDDDTDGDGILNADDDDADGDGVDNRDDDDDDNDGDTDEDDEDHHDEDDEHEIAADLIPTANAAPGSSSEVHIRRMSTGKIKFEVETRDFDLGTYEIIVDSINIGSITITDSSILTEVHFETNANDPGEILLTIDPAGRPVSLVKDSLTYFAGTVPNTPPAPTNSGSTSTRSVTLTRAPGVSSEAKAKAELRIDSSGASKLEIEIESIPAGTYDIVVSNVIRGTITLSGQSSPSGERTFRLDPESGELPLNFPSIGEPIEISQGGNLFFSGTLPSGS